jgi:hypothetical protein
VSLALSWQPHHEDRDDGVTAPRGTEGRIGQELMSDADLPRPMPALRRIGSRGTLLSSRATLIAAVCMVLVGVALANWIVQIPGNSAHTDFAASYASAELFREGHAAIMFDPAAQAGVLHAAGGGASPTTSPAALTPAAILLLVPFAALPLWLASLLWSLLQGVLLGLAALVATRAAPWPARTSRSTRAVVAVAAMCGGGTLMLLPLNQWDGVAAAALALTYADLREGHDHRAMLWLTVGLLVGKPHLGIGIALFLVARRPLSIVSGAIAAAVVGGMTILLVPLAAIGQWVGTIVHISGVYPASSTIGMSGLVGSFLGATAASTAVGYALAAAASLGCVVLGRWARSELRGHATGMDPLFLGVTLLSLLIAPHVFPYDLVLLIPGFIGCVAWATANDAGASWPGTRALLALGAWATVALVCFAMISPPGSYRPIVLLPMFLLGCALACIAASRLQPAGSVSSG